MPVSAKTVYKQLMHLKPYLSGRSISSARKSQHRLGEFMENRFKKEVISKNHSFENFEGAWLLPREARDIPPKPYTPPQATTRKQLRKLRF